MRRTLLTLVVAAVLATAHAGAQRLSPEAQKATQHYRSGWELMRQEAWDRAAFEFTAAVKLDPKFALAYYALGRADMALKKFPQAIEAYLKCRGLYQARAGETFASQMDLNKFRDEQIAQYKEAMRAANYNPQSPQSQTQNLYMQHLAADLRQLEQAKDRNTVTFENGVPFFVSLALGAAYFRAEKFADAEREYKAAIDANPGSGETFNNLAVLYMLTNRLDDAAKAIAAAEQTGYKVNPGLKDELKQKMGK